jgi:hypothetical protein
VIVELLRKMITRNSIDEHYHVKNMTYILGSNPLHVLFSSRQGARPRYSP